MYNNPNFFSYAPFQQKATLFSTFKRLNFSDILNRTQKTLNLINQAIPIFYQIKPLWANAKTVLKIANAINDNPTQIKTKQNTKSPLQQTKEKKINYNEPTFFI